MEQIIETENNGTMEQKENTFSLSNILTQIYYDQYELNGLNEYERELKIAEINDKYAENSRFAIPSLSNFIHERRKWIVKIITALVDEKAYQMLKRKNKDFSFSESANAKDFLCSMLSEDAYFTVLRRNIIHKEYFKVSEEDVDVLRFWIRTLYEDAGYNEEEMSKIINKFDTNFSLKFRQVQKELNALTIELSAYHVSSFSDSDFENTIQELQNLVDNVRERIKWDKEDEQLIKKVTEEYFEKEDC